MSRQLWSVALAVSVGVSVCFSVLLVSVAFGVNDNISERLSSPVLQQTHLVDVDLIDLILTLLTVVITVGMVLQTAASTFVLGVTAMQARREEIAIRRQSGVLRATLVGEFATFVLVNCLYGGVLGEMAGIVAGLALRGFTVLPISFTPVSVLAAFPVTVGIAVLATLIPAWRAASVSPALLRKE
jgi:putative ABC transport system permease protein